MRIQASRAPWTCEWGHVVPEGWPQPAPLLLPAAKGALYTYTCTSSLHHATLTLPSALNSSQPLGQALGFAVHMPAGQPTLQRRAGQWRGLHVVWRWAKSHLAEEFCCRQLHPDPERERGPGSTWSLPMALGPAAAEGGL